jgi:TrmH family RNA methyltransferase
LKYISSKNNPIYKKTYKLSNNSRYRRINNLFIVEGLDKVELAHENNFMFLEIIVCTELLSKEDFKKIFNKIKITSSYDFSKNLFNSIVYSKKSDGLLAVVEGKEHSLNNFKLSKTPYILVAESIEKPGNIGALLRTVDAAGMDGLIIANPDTELYNPNTIRSSLGSIMTTQIAMDSSKNVIDFLKKNNVKIYSTFVKKSINYTEINYSKSSAIVVGKESSSLSKIWREESDELIGIPMLGKMDSLNLSVCAAIVIFEGLKQRNGN